MEQRTVYRLRGEHGELLYVGQSGDVAQRLLAHQRDQPWWWRVREVELAEPCSPEQALADELTAIQTEHPTWNVMGTGRGVDDQRRAAVAQERRTGPDQTATAPELQRHLDAVAAAVQTERRCGARLRQAVQRWVATGATWQQVGDLFGITRQSAHERFTKH